MITQILNPKGCNPNDIQRTIHTEHGITRIVSKYPNGFVLTVEQDVDGNFTIIPSGEVIDLGNGVFQIKSYSYIIYSNSITIATVNYDII